MAGHGKRALALIFAALLVASPAFAQSISTQANSVFRDYNTPGNALSGIYNPPKADVRTLFGLIDSSKVNKAGDTMTGSLTTPKSILVQPGNGTDLKYAQQFVNTTDGNYFAGFLNDAQGVFNPFMTVSRSGAAPAGIAFFAPINAPQGDLLASPATILGAGTESWIGRARNSTNTGNSIYQQIFPNVSNSDGLQGILDIPPGSTAINAGAVAGYVRNRATNGTNGVALMGVGTIEAPGAVWGVNTLLQDSATRALGSATGREMIGYENDLNVMNPATTVIGYSVGGNSLAQPVAGVGYNIAMLNGSTGIYWPTGFGTQNGAAQNGIALGTYAGTTDGAGVVSANAPSQKFLWGWTDGAAAHQSTVMQMAGGFMSISATGGFNGISLGAGSYYAQPGTGLLIGGNNAISADGSNNYTVGDGTHNLRLTGPLFVPSITTTGTAVGTLCVNASYQVYLKTTAGSCV